MEYGLTIDCGSPAPSDLAVGADLSACDRATFIDGKSTVALGSTEFYLDGRGGRSRLCWCLLYFKSLKSEKASDFLKSLSPCRRIVGAGA